MTALDHDVYVACAFCDASHRGDLPPARWRVTRDSRVACPPCAAGLPAARTRPTAGPEPVPVLERGEWVP